MGLEKGTQALSVPGLKQSPLHADRLWHSGGKRDKNMRHLNLFQF